jgi:hypothetical protein
VEQKAKEAYQSALAKAHELGVYNECSAKALEGLRRYDPVSYGEVAELLAPAATGGLGHPEPIGLITSVPAVKSTPAPLSPPPAAAPSAPAESAKAPLAAGAEAPQTTPPPQAMAPVDPGPATARDFPTEADRPKAAPPKSAPEPTPAADSTEPKE